MPRPVLPSQGRAKGRRCLPKSLAEGSRERVRSVVASLKGDICHARATRVRQTVRGSLKTGKLDVAVHRQAEQGSELAVKVVFRQRRDPAQHVEIEVIVEMPINVIEHPDHACAVMFRCVLHERYVARRYQCPLDQSCYSA